MGHKFWMFTAYQFHRKMFSLYTSVQGREVFMGNSATRKVIGKGTIQFRSHNGCIITLQGVRHVPESRYNLISLGALYREGFRFSRKVILWKFPKRPMWCFKPNVSATCICCKIQKLQLVDCSYSRLRKRRLWNNQRLWWFRARIFSCIPKRDWD